MIEIVGALRGRLVANGAVAALVGTRIYPEKLPQSPTLPAIVVTPIVTVPTNTLSGEGASEHYVAQIDCYSSTFGEAQAVAAAVGAVLGGICEPAFSSVQVSRRNLYEDETESHRVSIDVSAWARGA